MGSPVSQTAAAMAAPPVLSSSPDPLDGVSPVSKGQRAGGSENWVSPMAFFLYLR
jgi:hypothetical protein